VFVLRIQPRKVSKGAEKNSLQNELCQWSLQSILGNDRGSTRKRRSMVYECYLASNLSITLLFQGGPNRLIGILIALEILHLLRPFSVVSEGQTPRKSQNTVKM